MSICAPTKCARPRRERSLGQARAAEPPPRRLLTAAFERTHAAVGGAFDHAGERFDTLVRAAASVPAAAPDVELVLIDRLKGV